VFSVGGDGAIAVVDPEAGDVVARARLSGRVEDAQPAGSRLVVLLEQQLAVVSARGAVRLVPLPGVVHGGLAVSPRVAYVAVAGSVLEVPLAGASVTRHALAARAAKDDRPWRNAALLDGDRLAISGCDRLAADHRTCASPFGLRLVDTRRWTARVLDRRGSCPRACRTCCDPAAPGSGACS
jgi:hypothetical protein